MQSIKEQKAGTAQKRKKNSMMRIMMRRLRKNRLAMLGLAILIVIVLLAVFAPYISPYDYSKTDFSSTFQGPSAAHWFGTDELGRDIFSRLLYGARYSLSIGLTTVAISAACGVALGAIAGYVGGKFDMILMRVLDVFQALPGMILAIAIAATLGGGMSNCVISLAISSIPGYARMTRASILNIRQMEYVEAAASINAKSSRIIIRHILPNALSPIIVQATMGVAGAILAAASLSFVGLGVQAPNPEWGAMLSAARNYIRNYPHMVITPGVTIMITILSLNMLGDGLRDALDPRLKD